MVYTAAFAILALAVFFPFLTSGKSMVGNGDGQSQYILQLRYMGEWLRETFQNFLHGNFTLRTYDFTIGMGDDINSIVRFHPLDYLSVFVPAAYTEQLYAFLIFLRLYLAGLAFSLFGFYWKRNGAEVLAGSMVYLFCGYVFELGIVHPIYVAPMIVTPLLLLGAEYMMDHSRRHSFVLFSVMVYLGFTSNYYFMYINSVALLVYVLIRFFVIERESRENVVNSAEAAGHSGRNLESRGEAAGHSHKTAGRGTGTVREFFSLFVRMVSAYLVGLLLSAVTLFPTLQRFLNSYRSANLSDSGSLLFYDDARRYFAWVINLISPLEASGNGTHLNFAVIVLPAVTVLLLSGKGRWKSMKRILFSLALFLLIPLGGYIMAVMHTENNRWVYLISLAAAMCVTFVSDSFCSLNTLQKRALFVVMIVYDLAVAVLLVIYPLNVYHLLAAVELTVTTIIILSANRGTDHGAESSSDHDADRGSVHEADRDMRYGADNYECLYESADAADAAGASAWSVSRARSLRIVLCVTVVSSVLNGYFTFGGRFGNLTRYYADRGTTQTFFSNSKYANYALANPSSGADVWADGFYRVDGIWSKSTEDNASLQLGYPGVQIYNSILNASQISYMLDTQNIGLTTMLHIHSLDGRSGCEALAGVRYFQTEEKCSIQRPYGFNQKVWSDGKMAIWENDFPLAFGFTADQVIPASKLEKMSGAEIEEVMLSAVVLPDEDAQKTVEENGLTAADGQAETGQIEYADIALPESGKKFERTENGYRAGKNNAAIKLAYQRKAGYEVMLELTGLKPDGMGAALRVKGKGIRKRITLLSSSQTYTLGREDYLVSLGYASEDSEQTLKLSFTKKGNYSLDGIRIVYVPRENYEEKISALNQYSLQDVTFGDNTVSGNISLDSDRLMVFQIPYSKGWSARVNGKDVPLLRADECYMGIALEKGENEISLVYRTPAGRLGVCLSLAGLVLLILGYVLRHRKKTRS